jgi:hypothetical protein
VTTAAEAVAAAAEATPTKTTAAEAVTAAEATVKPTRAPAEPTGATKSTRTPGTPAKARVPTTEPAGRAAKAGVPTTEPAGRAAKAGATATEPARKAAEPTRSTRARVPTTQAGAPTTEPARKAAEPTRSTAKAGVAAVGTVRPLLRRRDVTRRIRGTLERQREWQMNRRLYRYADRWLRRREVHRLRQVNGRRL